MTELDKSLHKNIVALFSGYRAEWLQSEIFDLFTEPDYFPQLTARHPVFLVGGRGTGKTTTLRCLSYEGQHTLRGVFPIGANSSNYCGVYYRVNTNRVAAFWGDEIDERSWSRLFGHYFNLEVCEAVFECLGWLDEKLAGVRLLEEIDFSRFARSLGFSNGGKWTDLARHVEEEKMDFELKINSIADSPRFTNLSLQGAPIDALMECLLACDHFRDVTFCFLIDEFENFLDYQQRIVNTLIKHCGSSYSFNVGVRELGVRETATLNAHERLNHPADYKRIDIAAELEPRFSRFAAHVCQRRLDRAFSQGGSAPKIRSLFPGLGLSTEAEKLGVAKHATQLTERIATNSDSGKDIKEWVKSLSSFEIFALNCTAESEAITFEEICGKAKKSPAWWKTHLENYGYAYLFHIRAGKRGLRKYYAGWEVFCGLAAGNIRYLIELVDRAIELHLKDGRDPVGPIDPKIQTKAAQLVGQKNLRELEGLSIHGAKLTRLLLSLGRIFQVMAEDPLGHTPEVSQFFISDDGVITDSLRAEVETVLTAGIMNLALLRYPGSKLQEASDVRQYDYALHPIFAAFFGFSHRRKRKILLSSEDLIRCVKSPKDGVQNVLRKQNRHLQTGVPEQMVLFEEHL